MRDINEPCGDNLGGINSFEFIPITDISSIPDLYRGKLIRPIVLVSGKRWFKGYGTFETIGFTEDDAKSKDGTSFLPKFKCVVPKELYENEALYFVMRHQQFIVKYKNNNGLTKIIGTLEEPLQFTYSLNTGSTVTTRNQHNIEFFGDTTRPAIVYDI